MRMENVGDLSSDVTNAAGAGARTGESETPPIPGFSAAGRAFAACGSGIVQGILRSAGWTGVGRTDDDFIFAAVRSGVHSARPSGVAEGPRIGPAGTVRRPI